MESSEKGNMFSRSSQLIFVRDPVASKTSSRGHNDKMKIVHSVMRIFLLGCISVRIKVLS